MIHRRRHSVRAQARSMDVGAAGVSLRRLRLDVAAPGERLDAVLARLG